MAHRKRIIAMLLCIGLVLAMAVSSAFIAHEAGHSCSGEDCSICRMIVVNVNLLRTIGLAVLLMLAVFALLREKFAHREQQQVCLPASGTLVSWKIRLND